MPERIARVAPFVGTVGLRFTEVMTLTDDRVDVDACEIHIPRDVNKSRRAKPILLARAEVPLLREQLLVRPPGTRVVFATANGGCYSERGFRGLWTPGLACPRRERNGRRAVVADFHFQWLRHTAISPMAGAGMKPELIAQRVGHTDGGALVYRRYRHLYSSELPDAV